MDFNRVMKRARLGSADRYPPEQPRKNARRFYLVNLRADCQGVYFAHYHGMDAPNDGPGKIASY